MMANEKIYQEAVRLWGFEPQVQMIIEEMAELTAALCRGSRGGTRKQCMKE